MTEPDNTLAVQQQLRNEMGRFAADPNTPERDAKAATLRKRGWSPQMIADELHVDRTTVYAMLERAYRAIRSESASEARQMDLDRLDDMIRELERDEAGVRTLMGGRHVTVSQGRVVYDDNGEPVPDQAFALQCMDRIERMRRQRLDIMNRRARYLGLDMPAQAEVAASVTYRIIGLEPEDTP